jgi:hypothetical protein
LLGDGRGWYSRGRISHLKMVEERYLTSPGDNRKMIYSLKIIEGG